MRTFLFHIFFLLTSLNFYGQKQVIDTSVLGKWSSLRDPKISRDGAMISYEIHNHPPGKGTLIIKKLNSSLTKEIPGGSDCQFSSDSRCSFYLNSEHSLVIMDNADFREEIIPDVREFELVKNDRSEYLVMQFPDSELVLRNLQTRFEMKEAQVSNYWVNPKNTFLVCLKLDRDNNEFLLLGKEINDPGGCVDTIWTGKMSISDVIMDSSASQMAILAGTESQYKEMLRYDRGSKEIKTALSEITPGIPLGKSIDQMLRFSSQGDRVFFTLRDTASIHQRKEKRSIWYAEDSPMLPRKEKKHSLLAIYDVVKNRVIPLEYSGEEMYDFDIVDQNALLVRREGSPYEWKWHKAATTRIYEVDCFTGDRRKISGKDNFPSVHHRLSPNGRFVIFFDAGHQSYYSHDIQSGIKRNLTKGITTKWTEYTRDDEPVTPFLSYPIPQFLDGQTALVYDQWDIWKIDLSGKKPPVCLTNRYGKIHDTVFRLASQRKPEVNSEKLLVSAFNQVTKKDGYAWVMLNKKADPVILTMKDSIFTGPEEDKYVRHFYPIKADSVDVYLVRIMSAKEPPNVFITTDFKQFEQVSFIQPEKQYNWLSTELVTFKVRGGGSSQGIMYKPENFDPKKKYPVIFYYYEKISEQLNNFIEPEPCEGPINIPYFVSNGYLVFTPDIHFTIGWPGRSSLNHVMGAADFVAKLPYVDSTKMALQGHSFGGFQTNYIISHTNRFAAACSAAGFTNFVSSYGAVVGKDGVGGSRQPQYELYRDRIGSSLWENPSLYLENSPVMRADEVNTPLLLVHNPLDYDVIYQQGVEWFTGLRRNQKSCWFLQYADQGHMTFDEDSLDLSQKMLDFFDHFLKRKAMPAWMKSPNAEPLSNNSAK